MATGRWTANDGGPGRTRRALLRAGALLAVGGTTAPLTGCDLFDGDEPQPPPDPLEPLAAEARELAARHRAAIAADLRLTDRLTPIADAHAAHADEIHRLIGRPAPSGSPGPQPSAGDRDELLAGLREAEQRGHRAAAKACTEAPGERAALLGSITAARATHVEALT